MRALLIFVCSGLIATSSARDWRGVESPEVRGVVIPLYSKRDHISVANVRIGRVFPDYERKGFFRVGLFPLLVGEDVQIEVLQGRRALNPLARLQQRFDTKERRLVEWRKVTFTFAPDRATIVRVGRVRMVDDARWDLLDGVCIEGHGEMTWPKAVLYLSGPKAGHIESGSKSVEVFKGVL